MNLRQLFLQHLAPTSTAPLAIEVVKAEGCRLQDADGKEYIDLIGGISVANTGHRHPQVLAAIRTQLDAYLHVMVYGELVQGPQVHYAQALAATLPPSLQSVYFTNSGAEAVEGAMKLAKRLTGRTEIAAFDFSYHGSTQGALSLIGSEYWRNAYRPLLPGIRHLRYGSFDDLEQIASNTACVVVETVQAEGGILVPPDGWLPALQARCRHMGTLLVVDEIQAGFGRTGTLWGFEQFGIVPDVLLLGKALGGGLPLGAFIASRERMQALADAPVLGHITTFGGHPLSCAAGLAALEVVRGQDVLNKVKEKEALFRQLLVHPRIRSVNSFGLWMAVEFGSFEECKAIIDACIERGVFSDWFLFASHCLRIAPPLTITEEEIREACGVILEVCGL